MQEEEVMTVRKTKLGKLPRSINLSINRQHLAPFPLPANSRGQGASTTPAFRGSLARSCLTGSRVDGPSGAWCTFLASHVRTCLAGSRVGSCGHVWTTLWVPGALFSPVMHWRDSQARCCLTGPSKLTCGHASFTLGPLCKPQSLNPESSTINPTS